MEIKSGSKWVDDKSGLDVVVKSIIAAAFEKTKVVYDVFDNSGNCLGYNSCTYELFLDSKTPKASSYEYVFKNGYDKAKGYYKSMQEWTNDNEQFQDEYSKGYEHGVQHMKMQDSIDKYLEMSDKLSLTEDEVDNIIDEAFEEGYAQAYSELQTKTEGVSDLISDAESFGFREGYAQANRERALQEKAWDEGYDQAVYDLIDDGIVDGLDEEDEYSEYEFGDVEDDEEEYCFSKELDKILNGAFVTETKTEGSERKHSHYFKDVRNLDYVDIYQVCKLFEVDDPSHCTQHSIKKLLMSGKRGAKDKMKDIIEARDTLNRYLQIEGIE